MVYEKRRINEPLCGKIKPRRQTISTHAQLGKEYCDFSFLALWLPTLESQIILELFEAPSDFDKKRKNDKTYSMMDYLSKAIFRFCK